MFHLRRVSPAPIWLVGTSRGTISASNHAVPRRAFPQADGLVLTSSLLGKKHGLPTVFSNKLENIPLPTLVVHHRQDGCGVTRFGDVPRLMEALGGARVKELIAVEGGSAGNPNRPCKARSYHGFLGIEPRVVQAIAGWIRAHPPR